MDMHCRFRNSVIALAALAALSSATFGAGYGKVFPVETSKRASTRVEYVMSLTESEMLDIIPVQSGIYFTDCPNCDAGAQDRSDWRWVPQQPRQIACKGCGAVYPGNPDYPDNKSITVPAPEGTHTYPYYTRPDGYRIFFRAHADFLAREYMAEACRDLANLYWTTKDEQYAGRAALILLRFAEVYPGYAYKFDYPFREKKFAPYTQNRIKGVSVYRVSKWSWWAYMGISQELLEAYDAVRFWPGLDAMDDGKARHKIEHDLFEGMVAFVMGFRENYSNMSPGMWRTFIQAGRVLDRPEWVHEALKRVNHFMSHRFQYDGFWLEPAPSYCGQVLSNLRSVAAALKGYAPPETAAEPLRTSLGHFADTMAKGIATLQGVYGDATLPHGGSVTINDTWARRGSARAQTRSRLVPGLGLAMLGGGERGQQICAWLNYTSGAGHKHMDALSMGLFAFGDELLRDIGYTHTAWRRWSICMMSHNTVVVNGTDSNIDRDHTLNRLRCFVTDGDAFHLVEAESDAAYPDVTTRFRRTLVLVGGDSRDAYLIDVFQVHGGEQHDYLLHGSAAQDSTATVLDAALKPFDGSLMNPGVAFEYPKGESFGVGPEGGYGFVRNLSRGEAGETVTLDLRLSSRPEVGTRTHLVCGKGTTIFLGEAPRLRQAERNDQLLPTFRAPVFCARRQGQDLHTVFVAIHEQVNGTPHVRQVNVSRPDGVLRVAVDRDERGRDVFLMALDKPAQVLEDTPDGELRFRGRWGLARTEQGQCRSAHLVEGEELALAGLRVAGELGRQGQVRGVGRGPGPDSRGYLQIAESIDTVQPGTALLLTFADRTVRGYNVVRSERLEDGSRIYVHEDPGFALKPDAVEWLAYPQHTIDGARVDYWLPGVTHVNRE